MTGEYDYDDDYDDFRDMRSARVPEAGGSLVRRAANLIGGLLMMCLLLAAVAGGAYLYVTTAFDAPGPLATDRTVDIARGQGLQEIAATLYDEGVVDSDKIFIMGVLAHRANGSLKAGEYQFPAGTSMNQVMSALTAGRAIQYSVTVPEGLTTRQIVAKLEADPVLTGEISQIPAEGALLPDTYAFTRGTSRQAMISRMRDAQQELVEELWASRAEGLPIDKPYEALILASIVEKETGVGGERARVASVFVNRLRRSMRLQSDPTIIYGIVGGEGSLGRPLTRTDINTRTPYNTYKIDGLPPTPIANPGRAAIAAVLQPATTDDLFFVADGTGGHAFAASLVEHNRNVAEWRKIERERRNAEREAERAAAEAEAAAAGEVAAANDADTVDPAVAAAGELASQTPGDTAAADAAGDGEQANAQQPETQEPSAVEAGVAETPEPAAEPEPEPEPAESPDARASSDPVESGDGAGGATGGAEPSAETDREYPLPLPKPEPPQRASSASPTVDVTVVPLPAANAN